MEIKKTRFRHKKKATAKPQLGLRVGIESDFVTTFVEHFLRSLYSLLPGICPETLPDLPQLQPSGPPRISTKAFKHWHDDPLCFYLRKAITCSIDLHGPITLNKAHSTVKRVYGVLKSLDQGKYEQRRVAALCASGGKPTAQGVPCSITPEPDRERLPLRGTGGGSVFRFLRCGLFFGPAPQGEAETGHKKSRLSSTGRAAFQYVNEQSPEERLSNE